MERYKVTLAYDGTHFFGFQRQGKDRTVQLVVEAALQRLRWQGRTILSSGRTDRGVHAAGQVIAFDLEWSHGPEELARAMNAHLPKDVTVKAVEIAPADFHPRFDAVSRCYNYHLLLAPERDPLRDRFTWRVWPPCEVELLQAAARLLLGTHDFAAFGTPPRPGGSTIRQVFSAGWQVSGRGAENHAGAQNQALEMQFEVIANAFLYHMVRRMVFLQVQVGQQRLSLEAMQAAVEQQGQGLPEGQGLPAVTPGLAQPQGLVLQEVAYAKP